MRPEVDPLFAGTLRVKYGRWKRAKSGLLASVQQSTNDIGMYISTIKKLDMRMPAGEELKVARLAARLNQAQAAELMGYSLQVGSHVGVQSRTRQALESASDERCMQGPIFPMFLLLTGQHPDFDLVRKVLSETDAAQGGKEEKLTA